MSELDRSKSKLHEMVVRGRDYREEYEFELYGEEVTAILRPLEDEEFLPLVGYLANFMDLEETEDGEYAMSDAIQQVQEEEDSQEDAATETIDPSKLDKELVNTMQEAAAMGLAGAYDSDGNEVELDDIEERRLLVSEMMGGHSVELGARVLKVSGDVRDADKFRGKWGRVSNSSPR